MKLEDIIEGLNKHIEEQRVLTNITVKGHIVLQRIINTNPSFKAYKSFRAILWFNKEGYNYKLLEVTHSDKIVTGQEEVANKELGIKVCQALFNWFNTDSYKEVLTGNYKENAKDETIKV